MNEVISLADARSLAARKVEKEAETPVARTPRKSIGLGVMIVGPHSDYAFGVLGGNLPVGMPAKVLMHPDTNLSSVGRGLRRRMGITLESET